MKETIWGLDIGTTSIGFAVVEYDAEKHARRDYQDGS